jgi:hypothetical protein
MNEDDSEVEHLWIPIIAQSTAPRSDKMDIDGSNALRMLLVQSHNRGGS